jgi:hypothetical protein
MVTGEDLALVGVKLVGKAALGQALAKAIQKPAQLLRVVILRVRDQPRTVIDQGDRADASKVAAKVLGAHFFVIFSCTLS